MSNCDDIDNLKLDLRSDKAATRQKAFTKLSFMVTQQRRILNSIFRRNSDDPELSYNSLFYSAHEGIKLQGLKLANSDTSETDNRIKQYTIALQELVEASICPLVPKESVIQSCQIVQAVCEVLRTDCLRPFGNAYLSILNTILNSNSNLTSVQCDDWKDLVKVLLQLLKSNSPKFKFFFLVKCTQKVIEAGCQNSFLAFELMNLKVFDSIKIILSSRTSTNNVKEKQEILVLAYFCCRDLAVDYRFELCKFLEDIADDIFAGFMNDNHGEYRAHLFKLMDVSLIIHLPNIGMADCYEDEYVCDKKKWYLALRNYDQMLLEELKPVKTLYRDNKSTPKVSIFLISSFAARYCSFAFWNDEIWQEQGFDDGEQNSKRIKCTNKLQSIIERIRQPTDQTKNFNWKWVIVLAEMITTYPSTLQNSDFLDILNLLSECQPLIESKEQIYAFTKCCSTLLQQEKIFKASVNMIVFNHWQTLWIKISEEAARCCSNSNKNLIESHRLMQLLIYHHKYSSGAFIESVIKIFISNSTIKCDVTLDTLAILLKSFNLDSLPNGRNYTKQMLQFAFEKITLAVLKKVIAGNERPSYKVLAHLAILCCLLKTDVINYYKNVDINSADFYNKIIDIEEMNNFNEYEIHIQYIHSTINMIRLKTRGKLLIECDYYLKNKSEKLDINENKKILPIMESKCTIDEEVFQLLMSLTELPERLVTHESTAVEIKDYLKSVMANNELMMNLLSELLNFDSVNEKRMENLFITKRIVLNMQEVERIFTIILNKKQEFDSSDTFKIVSSISAMLSNHYNPVISKLIRSYDLKNCLHWISYQMDPKFSITEDEAKRNKIFTLHLDLQKIKIEQKLPYLLITSLCEYFNFEGTNTDKVAEILDRHEFDMESNIDVHTIYKIIEILGKQANVPEVVAFWIWDAGIIQICKVHKDNFFVMNGLIEKLSELKKFTEQYDGLTKHFATVYHSLSKLCTFDTHSKKFFGPKIVLGYLHQFSNFHETYFILCHDQPLIKKIYERIYNEFLISKSFVVKMTAIVCLSIILSSNYERSNENYSIQDQKMMNQCRKNIFKDFISTYEYSIKDNFDEHNDVDVNDLSVHIQLFTSLFCANFNFRRSTLFELTTVFLNFNLSEKEGKGIFSKILKKLKYTSCTSAIDSNDIVFLMSKWIELSIEMSKFPWYLTGSSSYADFVNEHYNLILLAALKVKCEVVDIFLDSIELPLDAATIPIISSCLSYLIPGKAECSIKYENNMKKMATKLSTVFSQQTLNNHMLNNIPDIIIKVLENVVDNQKFLEMCGFQMDFCSTVESLKFTEFEKCMKYISTIANVPSKQDLISFLCRNNFDLAQQIFMLQKKNIQGTEAKEQKLLSFLHYIILVDETIGYMKDENLTSKECIKEYLSREIANFYCYLIVSTELENILRLMAADSLLKYLRNIIPVCSLHFKSQLQCIIPQLVALCKNRKGESCKIKEKCFKIMDFLIINQPSLKKDIAILDRFPSTLDFDVLRRKQLSIKYNDGNFTLLEEIEHFLEISDRRIEGLAALQEHLATKKLELKYLFEELEKMAGDRGKSTLHRLIRALVVYSRGNDEERAIEAIKCLGEIGCHNISTIIFNVEDENEDMTYLKFNSTIQCQRFICVKVLEKLEEMLIHHNVKIFQVASKACYYLLKSASSVDFKPSPFFKPFISNERNNENLFYLEPKSKKVLNLQEFVSRNRLMEYPTYVKEFCVIMTTFAGDKILVHLIQTQLQFAETLFPLVFHLLLLYNNKDVSTEIMRTLVYFFEQCFEMLNYSEQSNEGSIFINKKIIRQMLKLVEKVRIYCQDNPASKIASIEDFNYLHIAKAAKHCEAIFTAIQYCEMWERKVKDQNSMEFNTLMDNKTLQDVMYRSYLAIGIKEASDLYLNPITNRPEYLQTQGLSFQGLLEVSKESSLEYYMKLLNDVGLYHITNKINENMESSKKIQQYECLWKLCEWNTVVETHVELKDDKGLVDYVGEFEKYHYLSLQYCNNNDEVGLRNSLNKARKMILQLLTHNILECSNSLYRLMEMSHRLAQIEDFSEVLFKRTTNTHEILLNKWKVHDELPFDYEYFNTVSLQRNSILNTANIKAGKRTWIPDAIQSNSLFLIKQSIITGDQSSAIKLTSQLKNLITSESRKMDVFVEEAKLYMQKNQELSKACLTQVINSTLLQDSDLIILSNAYRLYGEILAENFSEEFSEIFNKYLDKSAICLEKYAQYHKKEYLVARIDNENELSQCSQALLQETPDASIDARIREAACIYDVIAKYEDREFEFKSLYISSPDFIKKKKTFVKNSERLVLLRQSLSKNSDMDAKKSYTILLRSTELDKNEIENAEKEKKRAGKKAFYYYVRSTIYSSNDSILNIFRIVSFILNFKNAFVTSLLNDILLRIPSYKFVAALPQITVRLNDMSADPLNCFLKKILTRCAIDHPHQTLPLILALVNSYADCNNDTEDEPRIIGAKDLWNSLKKQSNLKLIINEMEQMSAALIHLANLPLKSSVIPSDHKVLKLTKLRNVQCPTIDLPIMRNCDYEKSLITVEKWDPTTKSVGGINAPKRIEVLCSDGIKRPQLLKGKDDMRQDAIMQQIFGVVNKLLILDKIMYKNNARIRTYKVVPFSRRSGILEWCENTIPIGNYLVGEKGPDGKTIKKGAHEIYRPKDWPPMECLKKISDLSALTSNESKLQEFNNICNHIQPVFHHFFYEKFQNPGEHFERRFSYTISVAVSSMIGYILGIGDRHVQNILIDLKTAEIIHIDFGVAFEQGKILPHPELIPFRLTRDIISPLLSGINGIFRKACENTIQILRQNEKTLTTILEVLLYDPMYMWTIGADQARRSQLECEESDECSSTSEEIEHDLMASRALNCVKMKLKGIAENSIVQYPSIEGQVQYLIQAATNPVYLSKLFRGWQAYL